MTRKSECSKNIGIHILFFLRYSLISIVRALEHANKEILHFRFLKNYCTAFEFPFLPYGMALSPTK